MVCFTYGKKDKSNKKVKSQWSILGSRLCVSKHIKRVFNIRHLSKSIWFTQCGATMAARFSNQDLHELCFGTWVMELIGYAFKTIIKSVFNRNFFSFLYCPSDQYRPISYRIYNQQYWGQLTSVLPGVLCTVSKSLKNSRHHWGQLELEVTCLPALYSWLWFPEVIKIVGYTVWIPHIIPK